MILCLETATNLCSVALCNSGGVVSVKESSEAKSHASRLTIFIEEILKENGIKAHQLDAIAVSKGPGSYTGLRIGVSVAKGIAFAASLPLIGVETTLSMFNGVIESRKKRPSYDRIDLYCPMLDARRMEVYHAIYNEKGDTIKEISAEIIDSESFNNILESNKILFFGDGALKCREVIDHPNALYENDFIMSASYMYSPVIKAFTEHKFEDIAYFEPFYLKDFITTKSKKNIFGNKLA